MTYFITTGEPRAWIGLTSFSNGTIVWADNSPYDYNHFSGGHPDGASSCSDVCQVAMYTTSAGLQPPNAGNWDDFGANLYNLRAVCQEKSILFISYSVYNFFNRFF